jgi:hypothetical protein
MEVVRTVHLGIWFTSKSLLSPDTMNYVPSSTKYDTVYRYHTVLST